jgi:uncharacterized membrane protein
MRKITSATLTVLLYISSCLAPQIAHSEPPDNGINLYTPYISRSVTPGQSLNYDIEIINNTSSIQNISLDLVSLPNSWNPTFIAGTNTIQQIAVKPRELDPENPSKTVELNLDVPLRIKKGVYRFRVVANTDSGLEHELPLVIRVTEQGTFQTELQVDQANMEGYADSNFNYSFTLNNQTAQEQNYALRSEAPRGWDVRFRSSGKYVTSVSLASNESKDIRVEVKPAPKTAADTANIAIEARSGNTSAQATLEAVIKGKYGLDLTTPTGRRSTDVTAGGAQMVPLSVTNSVTVPVRDIELSSSAPTGWNVKFDSEEISMIEPGESQTVNATIKASSKAIAGDYRLNITADTPDASSEAGFRVTVNQSVTWGSIGILIILIVIGGISYLFKTYGRR